MPDGASILQIVNTIGLVILGVLFVLKTYRSQNSEIDSSTISSLNRQTEVFKGEIATYKTQMHDMTLKLGELMGINTTQKETIEKYEKILQNRNPELTEVLIEIKNFMKSIDAQTTKAMKELNYQTDLLKKQENRSSKLDKTHAEVAKLS